jgi:hypothetical protein
MPGEAVALMLVEVVGGLIVHVGGQAAHAMGRTWLDRRQFGELGDDAKQAFIAGLVFVASYDGALSRSELAEVDSRLRALDIEEKGREVALALAAREEVADAIGSDEAAYIGRLMARIPEGRAREALLRVSIAAALKGHERQLEAVAMLGKAMGIEDKAVETLVVDERQRLIR